MAASLIPLVKKTKVSSVLNRDVKQFGKKFLFDGEEDTCWNSDQGTPQFVWVEFSRPVRVGELHVQFQGGFVGKECWVEGTTDKNGTVKLAHLYPEDINSLQTFKVQPDEAVQNIKIVFNSSTDFFGRIIIYKLDILEAAS